MAALSKQQNFAVNTNKSQIYIEDTVTPLSYNYKTDQWSSITGYGGIGFYSVESGLNIGLVRESGTAVDLQQPDSADPALEAIITTGEAAFSDGSRRTITGVRPLLTDADANVSVLYRDTLNPTSLANFLLHSEDFSNAAWTKENSVIATNQTTAPDGRNTANLFDGNSGGGADVAVYQASQDLGSTGDNFCFSVFLKYETHQYVQIFLTGHGFRKWDIQTGTPLGGTTVAGKIDTYGLDDAGNGWFRAWVVYNNGSTSTPAPEVQLIDALGNEYTGTNGLYIWGAQINTGDSVAEYVASGATKGSASVSTTTESTINSRSGLAPFRIDSRYHRIKFRVSGGFDTILGADVEFVQTGRT